MVGHKIYAIVCNDKCYVEDLAADDECECSGIPPELKDKMKSCSMQYIPDEEFRFTSRSMLRLLQMCNLFSTRVNAPSLPPHVSTNGNVNVTSTDCNKCICSPTHHTMSLLDRVERLGPINTWPTHIIRFLFVDIPTPIIVKKINCFHSR
jgi:hypothetical protein